MRRRPALCAVLLAAAARPADAHIVAARLGDFYFGAVHPLTDLQDVLLWLALGMVAGTVPARTGRWLVMLFPLGLLVGLHVGLAIGMASIGPLADAGMTMVLGLLLAVSVRLPAPVVWGLALATAILRGLVNAGGVGPETNRVLFAAGLAVAGYAVITLVTAATLAFRQTASAPSGSWQSIAIRACGSWIAAIGLMMGGVALAS